MAKRSGFQLLAAFFFFSLVYIIANRISMRNLTTASWALLDCDKSITLLFTDY